MSVHRFTIMFLLSIVAFVLVTSAGPWIGKISGSVWGTVTSGFILSILIWPLIVLVLRQGVREGYIREPIELRAGTLIMTLITIVLVGFGVFCIFESLIKNPNEIDFDRPFSAGFWIGLVVVSTCTKLPKSARGQV